MKLRVMCAMFEAHHPFRVKTIRLRLTIAMLTGKKA